MGRAILRASVMLNVFRLGLLGVLAPWARAVECEFVPLYSKAAGQGDTLQNGDRAGCREFKDAVTALAAEVMVVASSRDFKAGALPRQVNRNDLACSLEGAEVAVDRREPKASVHFAGRIQDFLGGKRPWCALERVQNRTSLGGLAFHKFSLAK
jgi:hypothetical protein